MRQKLNLTAAAKTLHTSQPGVSKAIIEPGARGRSFYKDPPARTNRER
jgi:hypothetical protein